jgi:hypothetical protein
LKQRDIRRLKKAGMKFTTHTARYNLLDHRRCDDSLKEPKADPVRKKLTQYKHKQLNHVSRMEDIRCSKQLL